MGCRLKTEDCGLKNCVVFIFFAALLVGFRLLFTFDPIYDYHEMCHTGGVAREIVEHGHRFPLAEYSPDLYKNDYVFIGHAAVPFLLLFGKNLFSIMLVPLAETLILFGIGFFLLRRHVSLFGAVVYSILFLLAPRDFVFRATVITGCYLESTLFNFAIISLFMFWLARRGAARFALMGLFGGAAFFLYKGSALASAGAAAMVFAIVFGERRKAAGLISGIAAGARWFLNFCAAFLAGYLPWWLLSDREARALAFLAGDRFGATLLEAVSVGWKAKSLFYTMFLNELLDGNIALYAAALAGLAYIFFRGAAGGVRLLRGGGKDAGGDAFFALLAIYTAAFLAAMLRVNKPYLPAGYMTHLYPVVFIGIGALCHRALAAIYGLSGKAGRTAAVLIPALVLVFLANRQLGWTYPTALETIRGTGDAYYCTWRFGQAFEKSSAGGLPGAIEKCDRFEPPFNLECYTGVAASHLREEFGGADMAAMCGSFPPKGRAYCAWGVGKAISSSMPEWLNADVGACEEFSAELRRYCFEGAAWDVVSKLNYRLPECGRPDLAFAGGYAFALHGKFREMSLKTYAGDVCEKQDASLCGYVVGMCGGDCGLLTGRRAAMCREMRVWLGETVYSLQSTGKDEKTEKTDCRLQATGKNKEMKTEQTGLSFAVD